MTQASNFYCNWCIDIITPDEKKVSLRRNDKVYYFHNRYIDDCYVQWAMEENREKKKKVVE